MEKIYNIVKKYFTQNDLSDLSSFKEDDLLLMYQSLLDCAKINYISIIISEMSNNKYKVLVKVSEEYELPIVSYPNDSIDKVSSNIEWIVSNNEVNT